MFFMSVDIDSILSGGNTTYLLNLLKQYNADPESVDHKWIPVLEKFSNEMGQEVEPGWGDKLTKADFYSNRYEETSEKSVSEGTSVKELKDVSNVLSLIHSYRVRGHLKAVLDPLKLSSTDYYPDLDPKTYGFEPDDAHKPIFVNGIFGHDYLAAL